MTEEASSERFFQPVLDAPEEFENAVEAGTAIVQHLMLNDFKLCSCLTDVAILALNVRVTALEQDFELTTW